MDKKEIIEKMGTASGNKVRTNSRVFFLVACALLTFTVAQGVKADDIIRKSSVARQKDCDICPELVLIPAGRFVMGSQTGRSTERPAHSVDVKSFLMGRMEVTQAQWKEVMGSTPSSNSVCGDTCPVEYVSWDDVQIYLKKLQSLTGKSYRLPSEAEWEYAARAGTQTNYGWGDEATHDNANYGSEECCRGQVQGRDAWEGTAPVGSFAENSFGLFDMHGNVAEWTEDVFHKTYVDAPQDGRAWTAGNGATLYARVVRGGAWSHDATAVRASSRAFAITVEPSENIGFRVVRDL